MNEPTSLFSNRCPGCQEVVESGWAVCPFCGLRLKPSDDLVIRSLTWLAVLLAFVLVELAIARHDGNAAIGYGVLFGAPLAYAFGKAVVFRIRGRPLTLRQLQSSTLRAALIAFWLLVVVPVVLGAALLLLVFAVCAGMFSTGR